MLTAKPIPFASHQQLWPDGAEEDSRVCGVLQLGGGGSLCMRWTHAVTEDVAIVYLHMSVLYTDKKKPVKTWTFPIP